MSCRESVGLFQAKLLINRVNITCEVDKSLYSVSAKYKEGSLFLPVTNLNKNLFRTNITPKFFFFFFFEISRLNINTDLLCSVINRNIVLPEFSFNL